MKTLTDKQAQEAPPEDTLPQDLEETLYLLSIPGMHESILAGMMAPASEFSTELDW